MFSPATLVVAVLLSLVTTARADLFCARSANFTLGHRETFSLKCLHPSNPSFFFATNGLAIVTYDIKVDTTENRLNSYEVSVTSGSDGSEGGVLPGTNYGDSGAIAVGPFGQFPGARQPNWELQISCIGGSGCKGEVKLEIADCECFLQNDIQEKKCYSNGIGDTHDAVCVRPPVPSTGGPTFEPSVQPTSVPSARPTLIPSSSPSALPSSPLSLPPSSLPSSPPSTTPTESPHLTPSSSNFEAVEPKIGDIVYIRNHDRGLYYADTGNVVIEAVNESAAMVSDHTKWLVEPSNDGKRLSFKNVATLNYMSQACTTQGTNGPEVSWSVVANDEEDLVFSVISRTNSFLRRLFTCVVDESGGNQLIQTRVLPGMQILEAQVEFFLTDL